jgi:capsular polysaccharide biosynthesis protein
MAATGLAFLLEFLDNTIKDEKDVEEILGLPVLGMIPRYSGDDQ